MRLAAPYCTVPGQRRTAFALPMAIIVPASASTGPDRWLKELNKAMRQVVYGAGGVVLAESVVYRDIGSGFVALPMPAGERVTVEISPQQESVTTSASDPTIRSSRIVTTVAGRLGEWIVLGGSGQSADDAGAAGTRYSTRTGVARQRVMLRVDALD